METKKKERGKKATTHTRGCFLPWMWLEMQSVGAAGATGYSIGDDRRRAVDLPTTSRLTDVSVPPSCRGASCCSGDGDDGAPATERTRYASPASRGLSS